MLHSPPPLGSLIICSRNRPQLLLETVESVLGGKELPTEVVIVDQSDAPNAELQKWQARFEIRYIHSDSRGASRARNEGVRTARYELLAFIDDDISVTPDWYAHIITSLEQGGPNAIITGRVLPGQAETPGGFVPATVLGEEPRTYFGRSASDPLVSCNMAMYRSAFEAVGGFDERLGPGTPFPSAEDNDLGYRLLEAGYKLAYVPDALIYHQAWRDSREYFTMRWNYGCGQGAFYAKHLDRTDRFMLGRLGTDFALRIVRFPWRLLHRPRLAFGDLVFALGLVKGAIGWVLAHRGEGVNYSRQDAGRLV